jgi:arsenical pump membrane protein
LNNLLNKNAIFSVTADHVPAQVTDAALIGVDLGPNLSIAGSLATILWLVTLRRERLDVTTATFLRLGLLVMPPALVLSIACMILFSPAS